MPGWCSRSILALGFPRSKSCEWSSVQLRHRAFFLRFFLVIFHLTQSLFDLLPWLHARCLPCRFTEPIEISWYDQARAEWTISFLARRVTSSSFCPPFLCRLRLSFSDRHLNSMQDAFLRHFWELGLVCLELGSRCLSTISRRHRRRCSREICFISSRQLNS
jgi:hypothetical protein